MTDWVPARLHLRDCQYESNDHLGPCDGASPVELHEFNPRWTIHPCRTLVPEMKERGWSQSHVARELGVSKQTMSDICLGKRGYSADVAVKLGALFGTSAEFWWARWTNHLLALAQGKTDCT